MFWFLANLVGFPLPLTSTRPSPGAEPDSPDQPLPSQASLLLSAQDDDSNHGQGVFVITPPAYVLFPFADPFDDENMLLRPQFPSLLAPPGFAPIDNRQSLPGWTRPKILDTGSGVNRLPSVISPIAHIPSGDRCETRVPVSVTPVVLDNASGLLESLLKRLFHRLLSDTSVISDGTFYSASDSPARQTPAL